jgi:hypothetical protein
MMQRATDVKPMSNYLLLIRFDNGEKKIYNCFPLLNNPLYSKISEKSFFDTVHIDEMGVVCWNDAIDINPYELYEQSELLENFAFAV